MVRDQEIELIKSIPKEKIADFVFMHLRDMWAVDGLYFIRIEKKYGTKIATEIDKFVWEVMVKFKFFQCNMKIFFCHLFMFKLIFLH